MSRAGEETIPHMVSVESGEGWLSPADEAAMPKLQRDGRPHGDIIREYGMKVPEAKREATSGKTEMDSDVGKQGEGGWQDHGQGHG